MADGGPGATDGSGDPLDDRAGDLDGELGGLHRWAAEARVDQAVEERRRAAWLGRQPDADPTLADVLVGAAERARPVVVELLDGRRHRGLPTVVGRDMVEVRTEGGAEVVVAFAAVASVRLHGSAADDGHGSGPEPATHLAAELARRAEDRPRVRVVMRGTAAPLTGTLVAAGPHVVAVRLDGGDVAYAPLAALAEVSLPESG